MADKTGIEWTDATWNPVTGCAKVSQGCKHCYAEREWPRMTKLVPAYSGREFTDVRTHADRLDQPLRWKKPRMIFVNSMSDLFHEDVPDLFIDQAFAVMALAPQHIFQVLTKRPERMREYLSSTDVVQRVIHQAFKLDCEAGAWMNADHNIGGYEIMPLPNVWLGVSVENQAAADERIPLLLDTPAAVRWISAEPLLGPVDLSRIQYEVIGPSGSVHYRRPLTDTKLLNEAKAAPGYSAAALDWVVVGGESGPKARPMHPQWARSLRDQCAAAGVPFLFKQWGEWTEEDPGETAHKDCAGVLPSGGAALCSEGYQPPWDTMERLEQSEGVRLDGRTLMFNVGKKRAGRLLDGVQHDGYPVGAV